MTDNNSAAIPWEDHLLERKTDRELNDLRRTAVAFANSVKPGHTAVILVGEGNDGSVSGVKNADEMQRNIRRELDKIYPPIVWRQLVYTSQERSCIRIEIEYSGETPHFGDSAWVRKGSETIKASEEMFQTLIDVRTSKVRQLLEWLGRTVSVSWSVGYLPGHRPNWNIMSCTVENVTGSYTTFKSLQDGRRRSEPNSWLEVSWDDERDRLRVFVNPEMSGM